MSLTQKHARSPESLNETDQQLFTLRLQMHEQGMAAAIDTIASRFGLTGFERDVLLLCLAPEMDPSFERLYAYVQDDATRKFVTPYLALTLLACGEKAGLLRASFLPAAPLRNFSLLTADTAFSGGALSGCVLRLDEGLANHILGMSQLDERCKCFVRFPSHVPIPSTHDGLVAQLAQWFGAGSRNKRSKMINLIGPPDSGRLAVAQAVCDQLGLSLAVLDSTSLPPPGLDRRNLISVLEREAILLGLAFYFELESLKPGDLKPDDLQSFRADLDRGSATYHCRQP